MSNKRAKRLAIMLAVVVVLAGGVVLFGPWGPYKDLIFSHENVPKKHRDTTSKKVVHHKSEAKNSTTGERVEKRSNTSPPSVGIVVDDVGNIESKLAEWTKIDAPLSFSVMPYPPLSQKLAEELYKAGYLVMMHIPTENQPPNSFSGEGQLSTNMNKQDVFVTLDGDLSKVPNVSGINNHQGGKGCNDLQLMTFECEWAKQHGFYVVDSKSSTNSMVSYAAVQLGMGRKSNQVFIDHQNDPQYIRSAMRELAGIARKNGYAIGICHWHRPNTASTVGEMVRKLKAEGIHFAFARDINN
jgi:polysaccharide deacetylase 2 family uncharacterized protein YibQ